MGDFASAVLVGAARRALAADGIALAASPPGVTGGSGRALLPLDTKRHLLATVAAAHGLLPLLRVGRILPGLPPEPTLAALTVARDPADLFERWTRLERFTHSRHRVVLRATGTAHVVAEHVSRTAEPPEPPEGALVLGVLTGLLAGIGANGLTVTLEHPHPVRVFADGEFVAPPPGHGTRWWRFAWAALRPAPHPAAAGTTVGARARSLIRADPARRWSLPVVATELGTSTRTLQRDLHRDLDAGAGLSALLATTRVAAAADLLIATDHPLGAIGFACGFADQAHFTREFKRRTATTPAAYRAAFTRRRPL